MNWLKQSWKDSSFKWTTIAMLAGSVFWDVLIIVLDLFYFGKGLQIHYLTTVVFWGIYFLAVLPGTYIYYQKKVKRGIL